MRASDGKAPVQARNGTWKTGPAQCATWNERQVDPHLLPYWLASRDQCRRATCGAVPHLWQHVAMHQGRSQDAVGVVILIAGLSALQLSLWAWHSAFPHGSLALLIIAGTPLAWIVVSRRRAIGTRLRALMSVYLGMLVAISIGNAILLLVSVIRDSSDAPVALLVGGFDVLAVNMLSFGLKASRLVKDT